MSIHDRPYMRDEQSHGGGIGRISIGLPKPTPVTLGLIISCAVLFLVMLFTGARKSPFYMWMSLIAGRPHEIWRFVTFQFIHGGAGHFMWNMLGLYFFGPPLERLWGGRKFLVFYLACGVFAGLCFLLMTLVWPEYEFVYLLGASGGIMGCLMGCAILFPRFVVLVFPIRWVAAFLFVLYILSVAYDENLSDAAHLGGMVAAGLWIWVPGKLRGTVRETRQKINRGAWERKMRRRTEEEVEVNRILDKIRTEGLASLTRREKKLLQDATKRQKNEERDMHRL